MLKQRFQKPFSGRVERAAVVQDHLGADEQSPNRDVPESPADLFL